MVVVLLAEDAPGLADSYKSSLESKGFEVVHVISGLRLVKAFGKGGIDLILSDTGLTGYDGDSACGYLLMTSPWAKERLIVGMCPLVKDCSAINRHEADDKRWEKIAHEVIYKSSPPDVGRFIYNNVNSDPGEVVGNIYDMFRSKKITGRYMCNSGRPEGNKGVGR